MKEREEERYARMADEAESGEALASQPERAESGSAAAAIGRQLLLNALGDGDAFVKATRGRPPIGAAQNERGNSPVLRARVSQETLERFEWIARTTRQNRSDLLREAVDLLVEHYPRNDETQPADDDTLNLGVVRVELAETLSRLDAVIAQRGTRR